ncbi:MAG TPA: rhodanese-like domain-containing protein [Nakamurella sp.]
MRQVGARAAVALVAAAVALAGCSAVGGPAASTIHTHDASSGTSAVAAAGVRLIGPADFETQSADRVLINVHIPDEGSLPGTDLSLPYDEIDARVTELPAGRATPLAIYCMSGNMSEVAGRELVDLGYTDTVDLDGGMRAWQASGRSLLPAGS